MDSFKKQPHSQQDNQWYDITPNRRAGRLINFQYERYQSDNGSQEDLYHRQKKQAHSKNQKIQNIRKSKKITRLTLSRLKQAIEKLNYDLKTGFIKYFLYKKQKESQTNKYLSLKNLAQLQNDLKKEQQEYKQRVVGQNVIKSITEFLKKYQQTIHVFIEHDELKIRILTEQTTHCQSILHLYRLQDQMLRYISTFASTEQQLAHTKIEQKTLSLFTGLLNCLKCYLTNNQYAAKYKKLCDLELLFTFDHQHIKNHSIFIGGLQQTSLRFIKNVLRIILEHRQIILQNIAKKLTQINELQGLEIQIKDFQSFISKKIQNMTKTTITEQNNLNMQMSSKIHESVINNFQHQLQNLTHSNLYNSLQSFKIHLIQDAYFKTDGQETISKNTQNNGNYKIKNVKATGKLYRKKENNSNASQQQKINLRHFETNLLKKFDLFVSQKQIDHLSFTQKNNLLFYGYNRKDNVTVILFKYGRFHIITQNKQNIKKYKNILKKEYDCEVRSFRIQYCYQGNLNLKQNQKLILSKQGSFLINLISDNKLRQYAEKRILERKNYMNETKNYIQNYTDFFKAKLSFSPYFNLREKRQNFIGNFKEQRIFSIYLTNKGDFKIIGVKSLKQAQKAIKKLKNQIHKLSIKPLSQQKINRFVQNVQLMKIQLKGNSNLKHQYLQEKLNLSFSKNHSIEKQFKLRELDLFLKNQKVNYQQVVIKDVKLKILTWNIQSMKYFQKDKKKKQLVPDNLQIWIRQRLQRVVDEIIKQDAHFICLQETQIFYDKECNQRGKQFQNIIKRFQGNYYCSRLPFQQKVENRFRNFRSVILSKIPVKFYQLNYLDQQCLNNTMCEFQMNINGDNFRTILVSVHLKAQKSQQKLQHCKKRQEQLRILKKIYDNFPIAILAGDFNIGENYPQNKHSVFHQFKDMDDYFLSEKKPFTHYKKNYNHQRFDRVLVRIKDEKVRNSLLARPQEIGNFSCVPFQQVYIKNAQKKNQQASLSDHYGRFTEIMFKQ